jgi:hypothetical protein
MESRLLSANMNILSCRHEMQFVNDALRPKPASGDKQIDGPKSSEKRTFRLERDMRQSAIGNFLSVAATLSVILIWRHIRANILPG